MKKALALDVGGTKIYNAIVNENGEIISEIEKHATPKTFDEIKKTFIEIIKKHENDVDVIAFSTCGAVSNQNSKILGSTGNIAKGYPQMPFLELSTKPVFVENDANCAAWAEHEIGASVNCPTSVMITLGTGVGGGIIIDGKPLVGAHGAGGEIGHLCVNYEETDHCGCGNTGCLEQYASATGITRLANIRLAKDDKASVLRGQEVSAKTVFDAVKADDEVAKEIAEEFGKYLGHAMANLAAVADPSAIVIGGGVSKAGEVLLQYVEKNFKEKAFFANKDTEFVLATLGNDAGICGAAKLIL